MEREQILSRAFLAFARYGYRKASMDDVAREVGVSRQALYKRFGSKSDLFRLCIRQVFDDASESARASLGDTSLPLEERLLLAFDGWAGRQVDALRASPHAAGVLQSGVGEPDDARHAAGREFLDAVAQAFRAEGLLEDEISAEEAAFALSTASRGLLQEARSREDYGRRMKVVVKVMMAGLGFKRCPVKQARKRLRGLKNGAEG